jgi:23S rRNA (guanosine2251-2'-O)-methyltransferase
MLQPPFKLKSPSSRLPIFVLFAIICFCNADIHVQNAKMNLLAFVAPARYGARKTVNRVSVAQTNNDLQDEEETSYSANYQSRSTATPDASSQFYVGADDRRERLHQALHEIGLNPTDLIDLPEYRGSAALRTYSSFLLPKSEGALAMTNQPQRAAVVANNISFLMREHRSHQQEWLRNHDRSLREAEELLSQRNPITLVLDGIRSAHNVGNILRAAEAAKCQEVILCGSMTPAPPNAKVLKTALGAAEYVPYQTVGSTIEAVQTLKRNNVKVIGVETTSRSVPLWKASFFESKDGDKDATPQEMQQVAFVFGNELVGVDTTVLEECDELVAVPTHGIKNSLNVATCASVLIWEALRQWDSIQGDKS